MKRFNRLFLLAISLVTACGPVLSEVTNTPSAPESNTPVESTSAETLHTSAWRAETLYDYLGWGNAEQTALQADAIGFSAQHGLVIMQNSKLFSVTADPAPLKSPVGPLSVQEYSLQRGQTLRTDAEGNFFLVSGNNQVLQLDPQGNIHLLAGGILSTEDILTHQTARNGQGTTASFFNPRNLSVGPEGQIYLADTDNHLIRRITPTSDVSTFAGSQDTNEPLIGGFADGPAGMARFKSPYDLVIDAAGYIYVADTYNHRIRKISPGGQVSTLAGSGAAGFQDGQGGEARFNAPQHLAIDRVGNLYVADNGNYAIRLVKPDGEVSTLAGTPEPGFRNAIGQQARFPNLQGIALDAQGQLLILDNRRIRRLVPDQNTSIKPPSETVSSTDHYEVTLFAGSGIGYSLRDGAAEQARFHLPQDLVRDPQGNFYVADTGNKSIRKLSATGEVSTWIDYSRWQDDGWDWSPQNLALTADGTLYVSDSQYNAIFKVTPDQKVTCLAGACQLGARPVLQDGSLAEARFHNPRGLALDKAGHLYIADSGNGKIRILTPEGQVSTLKTPLPLLEPVDIAINDQQQLYILDAREYCVFRMDLSSGEMTIVAGRPRQSDFRDGPARLAQFLAPRALSVDAAGQIYISDAERIRRINADGNVITLAGSLKGYREGEALSAAFDRPQGLTVDAQGTVYIADSQNHRIRRLSPQ